MPYQIFLSYRRDDAASEAGRLFDRLTSVFDKHTVFQDVEEIKPGEIWPHKLRSALSECKLLLVAIGPKFLTVADEWGIRRIDKDDDWVRHEIETAFEEKKLIIPVLLAGAKMPPSSAFPASITPLTSLQFIEIRRDHWNTDFQQLIMHLERFIPNISKVVSFNYNEFDPLASLPQLEGKPPTIPFVGLRHFTESEAKIFFGRGKEIRMLYDLLTNSYDRVFLLNGPSAVGKSSLLHAGLVPRLKFKFSNIQYKRRGSDGTSVAILEDFMRTAGTINDQNLLVLDQLEEMWTLPWYADELSLEEGEQHGFARLLRQYSTTFPECRFLLSFRKEWLAEMRELLDSFHIKYKTLLISPLDHNGIREAVEGIGRDERLRDYYNLHIEGGLSEQIASDISRDNQSHIGPIVQMLLRNMWDTAFASEKENVLFSKSLYQRFYFDTLPAMVRAQLAKLGDWFVDDMNSGKVLDVLRFFTTEHGTAARHTLNEVCNRYSDPEKTSALVTSLQNLFFLQSDPDKAAFRLSHDALAPVLRAMFNQSDAPGQRASRLLEGKLPKDGDWEKVIFSETDIYIFKSGWKGMPLPNQEMQLALDRSLAEITSTKENLQKRQQLAIQALSSSFVNAAKHALAEQKHSRSFRLAELAYETNPKNTSAIQALIKAQAAHPAIKELAGHEDILRAIAYSPDGELIATASNDATVMIWELYGTLVGVLEGHTKEIRSVQFSPSGHLLLTASHDHKVGLWNTKGQLKHWLSGHTDAVVSAKFSTNGMLIASASADKTVRIWDIEGNCIHVLEGHQQVVHTAEFSPDDQYILSTSVDFTARIWDAQGNLLHVLQDHKAWIFFGRFSPDGTRVITASDPTAKIWSIEGRLLATLTGHEKMVRTARYSPDGQLIITASEDGTSRLWDAEGNLLHVLQGHTGKLISARFSADGTKIITASVDKTAKIWDTSGKLLYTLEGHNRMLCDAQFLPDERFILTASFDHTARIWGTNGENLFRFSGHQDWVNAVQFSPNGNMFATSSSDKTTRLWDSTTGRLTAKLESEGAVRTTMFSPDGAQLVTTSGKDVRLWTSEGVLLREISGHNGVVFSAQFSPDGNRIITACADKIVRIWDTDGGLLFSLQGHTETVVSAQFFQDGKRVLTAGIDDTLRIWSDSGSLLNTIKVHPVNRATLSNDNKYIIVAHKDGRARVWNLEGKLIRTFIGHASWVNSARSSPNGKLLVTTSLDRTVKIWDFSTGELLLTLEGHESATHDASFSPDSTYVISTSDKLARLWLIYPSQLIFDANYRGFACLSAEDLLEFNVETIDSSREGFDRAAALIEEASEPRILAFANYYLLLAKQTTKNEAFYIGKVQQLYQFLKEKKSLWLLQKKWESTNKL